MKGNRKEEERGGKTLERGERKRCGERDGYWWRLEGKGRCRSGGWWERNDRRTGRPSSCRGLRAPSCPSSVLPYSLWGTCDEETNVFFLFFCFFFFLLRLLRKREKEGEGAIKDRRRRGRRQGFIALLFFEWPSWFSWIFRKALV